MQYVGPVVDRTFLGASPTSTRASLVPRALLDSIPYERTHQPAPLDDTSLINGILKFDHPHSLIDSETYFRCYEALEYWFGSIFLQGGDSLLDPLEAASYLIPNTSSGWPWRCRYGVSKQEVLNKLSVEELLDHYSRYSTVYCASEKDELRLIGK